MTASVSYTSGTGHLKSADADVVVKTLADIEKRRGRLDSKSQAKALVDRSRPKSSPTHHLFEWDNDRAAEAYRLETARQIIISVRVVFADQPRKPVRAFPVVVVEGKKGFYPMTRARERPDLMAAVIERAKAEAVAWAERYERLRGIADLGAVFKAIDKIRKSAKSQRPIKSRQKIPTDVAAE